MQDALFLAVRPWCEGRKLAAFGRAADSHRQSQLAFTGHPSLFLFSEAFFLAGKWCFSKDIALSFLKLIWGEADVPLEDNLELVDESCLRVKGDWELQGRTLWMHNH